MRRAKKKDIAEKVRDFDALLYWGQEYINQADKLAKENDVNKIILFRDELNAFVSAVEDNWLENPTIQLGSINEKKLSDISRHLRQTEIEMASRIVQLNRDSALLAEMEKVAFPVDEPMSSERDFSTWARSPLRFPKSLLSALAETATPR